MRKQDYFQVLMLLYNAKFFRLIKKGAENDVVPDSSKGPKAPEHAILFIAAQYTFETHMILKVIL